MAETHFSYHGLRGNEGLLASGLPILTYHKTARRPRAAKWRSLYLSPTLFARQMAELAAAGFSTASLGEARPAAGNPGRKVVLTFDDGYANVLEHAAPVLAQHGFRAVQFLVAHRIGGNNWWDVAEGEVPERLMNDAEIREWLRQGHEIGSHTLTHPRLTRLSPAQRREEIRASKHRLEDRFGVAIRHFCYPYGDCDAAVVEEVRLAGYATACTHLQSGVSTAETPALELRRIEARYPKRNLRTVLRAIFGRWSGSGKIA